MKTFKQHELIGRYLRNKEAYHFNMMYSELKTIKKQYEGYIPLAKLVTSETSHAINQEFQNVAQFPISDLVKRAHEFSIDEILILLDNLPPSDAFLAFANELTKRNND